jgi:DNA modification methylase
MKLSQLKHNPKNPRTIKDERFKKLVKSLQEFPEMMAKRPMVCVTDVDGKLFPLGGNMRLKALQEIGMKEIPDEWVKLADDWTEEKRQEFVIKDNAGFGEWDWQQLAADWDLEQLEEWGLEVPDFGADEVLEALEDHFDTTPPQDPITVLGDLYEIGQHRLLCGDSTDSDQVAKLMNGQKAAMVFTDPPYRQEGHIEAAESEAKQQKNFTRKSTTEISPSLVKHAKKLKGLLDFEPKEFVQTLLTLNPLCVYIFCNKSLVKEYLNYFEGYNYTILVWKKPTVSPFYVADYLADIEYLLYFNKAGKKWNNKNVFTNYTRVLEAKQEKGEHPTIKPISIIQPAIENNSDINDLIFDLFLGSGSTMVASHQLKRKCYGMELDPKYCDVIVKRMLTLDPTLKIKRNGIDITSEWKQTAN